MLTKSTFLIIGSSAAARDKRDGRRGKGENGACPSNRISNRYIFEYYSADDAARVDARPLHHRDAHARSHLARQEAVGVRRLFVAVVAHPRRRSPERPPKPPAARRWHRPVEER